MNVESHLYGNSFCHHYCSWLEGHRYSWRHDVLWGHNRGDDTRNHSMVDRRRRNTAKLSSGYIHMSAGLILINQDAIIVVRERRLTVQHRQFSTEPTSLRCLKNLSLKKIFRQECVFARLASEEAVAKKSQRSWLSSLERLSVVVWLASNRMKYVIFHFMSLTVKDIKTRRTGWASPNGLFLLEKSLCFT